MKVHRVIKQKNNHTMKKSTSIKPPIGQVFVITHEGSKAVYNYTGSDISFICFREQYQYWFDIS